MLLSPVALAPVDWAVGTFTQHLGLDYAAAVTGLIGVWRLGSKHTDGFLWGIASCAFWIAFNLRVDSPPGVAFNLLWIIFNVRGLVRWAREHRVKTAQSTTESGGVRP
jgi:hypothetical protein